MEVAQIGRSICAFLLSRGDPLSDDFFIDSDLVEASCLSHDMGHPPFGHSGERTLQELMKRRGGFEGNAQTLHLLCETIYQNESGVKGMQPTRALLDGILKYKKLYTEFPTPPLSHFIYDTQSPVRDWVFDGAKIPGPLMRGNALNDFKSVECQIMDWADDAAYSLNDIVDGVRAGFLTVERIERWADGETIGAAEQRHLDTLYDAIRRDRLENTFSHKIGTFIQACRLKERDNFMAEKTNRYKYDLIIDETARSEADFFKKMANDIIFESPQLEQLEHKARVILMALYNAIWSNYAERNERVIRILPPNISRLIEAEKTQDGKARRICDFLAGQTDGMVVRTYRQLFDAEFGSFRDLS
jgi:dGTPase